MNFCITFAGAVGSGKTPIAYFLSHNFGLPIFNNDAIRTEVKEDLGKFDVDHFEIQMKQRFEMTLKSGRPFIYDVSVDRRWLETKPKLESYNFKYFIISLDLSRNFLENLYRAKGYDPSIIDGYLAQHNEFLTKYGKLVGLNLTDETFGNRLALSLQSVNEWMKKL